MKKKKRKIREWMGKLTKGNISRTTKAAIAQQRATPPQHHHNTTT